MANSDAENEIEPRAWISDTVTGEVRPVLKSDLTGLDEWVENWPVAPDLPSSITFTGWQESDEQHPVDGGKAGYRIVFKTIRTITVPTLELDALNLRLSLQNGSVNWGEPRFTNALPGRREGHWLVPEWGTLRLDHEPRGYEIQVNPVVEMAAHTENTPMTNYVEILYMFNEDVTGSHAEKLAFGRSATGPLTAALDLIYGERLLGAVITEEIGEIFPDWHWNRLLGGRHVAMEAQARLDQLDANGIVAALNSFLEIHASRDDEERARVRIAAQWYWRADRDADPTLRFLGYWLCVEALELGNAANIAPVKAAVAAAADATVAEITEGVGRMYGLRGNVAHGKVRDVKPEDIDRVRAIAEALLESNLLGTVTNPKRAALRKAVIKSATQTSASVPS
ncbi:hypothetical protein [Promicromonospora sp. MEB111]|uniref:hypothetical protein n=1 Tax=Promicromonospora sp. MEB111 TaxID=3040301 RepID=UPI0025517EF1|nr:hypothetical protein [Promicromonospora sp. MEB111]